MGYPNCQTSSWRVTFAGTHGRVIKLHGSLGSRLGTNKRPEMAPDFGAS
jgi:hypothetical protein